MRFQHRNPRQLAAAQPTAAEVARLSLQPGLPLDLIAVVQRAPRRRSPLLAPRRRVAGRCCVALTARLPHTTTARLLSASGDRRQVVGLRSLPWSLDQPGTPQDRVTFLAHGRLQPFPHSKGRRSVLPCACRQRSTNRTRREWHPRGWDGVRRPRSYSLPRGPRTRTRNSRTSMSSQARATTSSR